MPELRTMTNADRYPSANALQAVVLCGGSGTRLWPLSREHYPKQLLQLTGDRTMLQDTVLRLEGFAGGVELVDEPIVVCNEEYRFITAEQLREIARPSSRLILEPAGRNTAPALTLAALLAVRDGDPLLLVMPADHVIGDRQAFLEAVARAIGAANEGDIVTFGIVPERAETGYGYIRHGAAAPDGSCAVEAFVEKPDSATAQSYVDSGDYLWNSGLFLMRASVWIEAIRHFQPAMHDACARALAGAQRDVDFVRVGREDFMSCPADSIDYAVMEPLAARGGLSASLRVVPMQARWSDVGAWDALWSLALKDENGNAARGNVVFEASRDNLVQASSRLVACVGVRDLVVVETPDAVMVADRGHTQDVKKVVERLRQSDAPQVSVHRKVHRPWGYYDSIDGGERFQVKRIVVRPGASLSLQMHHHRAEHWIVVRGTARVSRGDEVFLLSENQSTYIPLGTTHRLENPGKVDLEMIEVQSGSYLGEDDIVRFEDDYGRG
ncbi:MAG TPA: mannose-1-phosphate guanylyltransferase/mannose-6-phosphate isomerase [Azoarcus taiwanensis]|nr:mannose-1-phosphate guanylyltransferase/mannose-6-phosphate isomerase [Azoarcus taiwanensis]